MTIERVTQQQNQTGEKTPLTVQNEIQKDVLKETLSGEGIQKQMLALLSAVQPPQQVQQSAQTQISKGYLDIKI